MGTDVNERVNRILERTKERTERRMMKRNKMAPRDLAADAVPRAQERILVAEGDSWFDYPGTDVLEELEEVYDYEVVSVAHAGDTIESMAYQDKQYEKLSHKLGKLAGKGKKPMAVLLSGGGNDIAGKEFELLLNHAGSGLSTLNEDIVRGFIDVRLKTAWIELISIVGGLCENHFDQRDIPIVLHGYGYAVPDGRGFWGGWGPLPGPWLEPGFECKGYEVLSDNTSTVQTLIDRFNTMVESLPDEPEFEHVHYVDVRPLLSNNLANYKDHWVNELHPEDEGFALVADEIQETLLNL
ncbi:MAG: hypothetical protein GY906_35515 [bacterium]|nr:hypothetical protein [bacterium]